MELAPKKGKEIYDLLDKGEVSQALAYGLVAIQDKEVHKDLMLLKTTLEDCENRFRQGYVKPNERKLEAARIANSYIQILDDLNLKIDSAEQIFIFAFDHYRNGEIEQAKQKFSNAIKQYKYYDDAYAHRGLCYAHTGPLITAIHDFASALAINPMNEIALTAIVKCNLKLGREKEAYSYILQLIDNGYSIEDQLLSFFNDYHTNNKK